MTDANRLRLSHVREVTLGTTPGTPRMRKARITGENIRFAPTYVSSLELRSDRMNSDPIEVNITNQGAINGELSFPVDDSPFSDWLESLFYNSWSNQPFRDNDGAADSVITAVTTTNTEVTHTTGAAFVASQLVRFTGFGVANNNGVFKCTTGGTTTSRYVGSGITDEAAPAAAARMKVVGFQGSSGDITATSTGIGSTTLDFTTLGLTVGQWIKIGGIAAGEQFATAALNTFARITAIAANALTLDNLPAAWTTDTGTGKTLSVWVGDQLKNGTTQLGQTLERGFLGQDTPNYLISRGMVAGQATFNFVTEQIATWSITFQGLTGEQTTTSLDASPDDETTNAIMAAAVNVGRIAENGVIIANKNYIRSCTFTINNNLRNIGGIRSDGLVGPEAIGTGSCDVGVAIETYFGSSTLLTKLFNNTATNINVRIAKNSQAMIWAVPRVTFTDGSPNATAKNTDVMLSLQSQASKDTLTAAHVLLDRFEYYQ
ncbi:MULTISPECIES: phage tail tube protein [unclassified Mesorhizobium]|uniref:phage tail tube protein n=2 Tax=Mesorhizobium TaxID=68287 RepID=UPI000FC9FBDF|nr:MULTISPECIES: phage tail tube protein [unclassified Mesorhizobium]TGP22293.1 hypothetical protein EN874_019465 [Mesorhizobium sp. M1D.F.Ca.ET.231.01.1.1]TGP24737.1 hypothetical protein EN877_30730 [Mesorhizobium sp. M1D.F.Ca.ET.234.01.1.1]TGS37340.1 hypothetical protein EN827_31035 [Mesorhizobium sp. M1D.F.Ca.ET.184.01.1.1]TGS58140.1 hypothetical protein EN826_031010 [Mesorhizobium sp. M1D.F.Ca.ET.183.01.1.1]